MTLLGTYYTYYYRTGSNTPDSDADWRFYFQVYLNGQSASNNSSTIFVREYFQLYSPHDSFWTITPRTGCSINSGDYNENTTNSGWLNSGSYLVGTRTVTVKHNSNGAGLFTFTGRGAISVNNYIYTITPTINLPTILRGTTITSFTVTNITHNSAKFNVSASNPIDYVQHSLNGGGWTDSGNQTLSGLNPGTQYSLKCRVRRTDTGIWTESNTIYFTTASGTASIDIADITPLLTSCGMMMISHDYGISGDSMQYQLNGGTWYNNPSGASVYFHISGLNFNTNYSVRLRGKRVGTDIYSYTPTHYFKTLDIARLETVPSSINADDDWTVTWSNNGSSNRHLGVFYDGTYSFIYWFQVSGSSYKFKASEYKQLFYNDMSTVNSKTYRVYMRSNDLAYLDDNYKNIKVNITNANPIFNNFAYEDTNLITQALTGDAQTIIKGHSHLVVRIPVADKAIAQKGANMTKYQLVVGEQQRLVEYKSDEMVYLDLNAIDNNVFTVYAIDSRNNSTYKQKSPIDYINYEKPKILRVGVERANKIGNTVTMDLKGTFFNENFGAVHNDMNIKYRFRRTSSADYNWQGVSHHLDYISGGSDIIDAFSLVGEDEIWDYYKVGDDLLVEYTDETTEQFKVVEILSFRQIRVDRILPYKDIYRLYYNEIWHEGETDLIVSKDGDEFTCNCQIRGDLGAEGFDNKYSYYIEFICEDELSIAKLQVILGSGRPNLVLHESGGISIGQPFNPDIDCPIQINGVALYEFEED